MNRKNIFRVLWGRRFSALGALIVLGLLFTAAGAKAGGCALPYKAGAGAAPAIPFVSPHADGEWNEHATIVGLWHVNFTANYDENFPPGGPFPPTPFPFVESFKTWHADGTEFENAFLPPTGGNICYGVWKDLGKGTVKLHHIGLMFNSDGSLSAIFTDDETDTVSSDGKTYKGMFDFKLWPPSYDAVGVGKPIAEVKGTVAATRITVD
ncbi:MAG TPA: hypothetical protein VKH63_09045 [Candidatus Acidoferrum sp.]|nr:hypothetical protein [Candidatus Acidoferrum sp.]